MRRRGPPRTGRRWRKMRGSASRASRLRLLRHGRALCVPQTSTGRALIVLGPHRRSGLLGHLQGSVAAAVIAHSDIPVMVFPEGSSAA